MKEKIIDVLFMGCLASPILLGVLLGKDVFFPKVAEGNMGAGMAILYLPIIFLLSGFSDVKMNGGTVLKFAYGIITFCVGAFLTFALSWWYLLVSVYAFVFLFLLASENYETR